MINFNKLAAECFKVLKGYGKTIVLYDDDGNKVFEPEEARRIFISPDNLMISLIADGVDSTLTLAIGMKTDINSIEQLINTLRTLASRSNVLFNMRTYSKVLKPKDFSRVKTKLRENSNAEFKSDPYTHYAYLWVNSLPHSVLGRLTTNDDQFISNFVTTLAADLKSIGNGVFPGKGMLRKSPTLDGVDALRKFLMPNAKISQPLTAYVKQMIIDLTKNKKINNIFVEKMIKMATKPIKEHVEMMDWFDNYQYDPVILEDISDNQIVTTMHRVMGNGYSVDMAAREAAALYHDALGLSVDDAYEFAMNAWDNYVPPADQEEDLIDDIAFHPEEPTASDDVVTTDSYYTDLSEQYVDQLKIIKKRAGL